VISARYVLLAILVWVLAALLFLAIIVLASRRRRLSSRDVYLILADELLARVAEAARDLEELDASTAVRDEGKRAFDRYAMLRDEAAAVAAELEELVPLDSPVARASEQLIGDLAAYGPERAAGADRSEGRTQIEADRARLAEAVWGAIDQPSSARQPPQGAQLSRRRPPSPPASTRPSLR
jgi:hypothetical protein